MESRIYKYRYKYKVNGKVKLIYKSESPGDKAIKVKRQQAQETSKTRQMEISNGKPAKAKAPPNRAAWGPKKGKAGSRRKVCRPGVEAARTVAGLSPGPRARGTTRASGGGGAAELTTDSTHFHLERQGTHLHTS